MCEQAAPGLRPLFTPLLPSAAESAAPPPPARGSRRRRLWELPSQALCPVIGVCLPMALLRRRLGKSTDGRLDDDYALHCGAIQACARRTLLAEALQRELDQRYATALRRAARHKTAQALAGAWSEALRDAGDIAGAFWATLSHARCEPTLQEQVLRDIHMLQHQLGAAERADQQRLDALADENAVLAHELARAQSRSSRLLAERAAQIEALQAEHLRLRGELLARDTQLVALGEALQRLEGARPPPDPHLAEQLRRQQERIARLQQALQAARQRLADPRHRAITPAASLPPPAAGRDQPAPAATLPAPPALQQRAVLCVGGRQAVVPIYRQLVERTGGRFLHHDGGEEDAAARLEASLAAADLVICQTGCISHDAYWRVKDHCKRHGKRCLFVDKPSATSLQRALDRIDRAP